MKIKLRLLIYFTLLSNIIYAQTVKNSLFKKNINVLVEEMEFMYGYDQTVREYTIFKTFDKSATNRI
ncbi:hypothetical protein [Tenacibaculum sp. SG-28]|uniref:hypothetical protein n=1 Tax=Tenacibaculum sp. SG-28 TaxID=754426 RepID=UPI000D4F2CC0|nr:hypothetical protein [Tenacibaculum sp. SG-28]PQJ20617.1 hypothetical protein BSU00_09900 [Tenacibaculum sp. SG-28]